MARMCGVTSGTISRGALVVGIGPGVRVASRLIFENENRHRYTVSSATALHG